MKSLLLFSFGLFFGFFDLIFLFLFFSLSLFSLFFEMGGLWFGGFMFCDSISFFLLYLTFLVFVFCLFSSMIDSWTKNSFSSFILILFFIFVLLFLSFTFLNVFLFYICFEAIFMFMFIFVLMWGYSPERVQASFYMVFYTIVVSFPFLVYLVLYEESFFSLKMVSLHVFGGYWWAFLFLVFFVKLPVYTVHLWLPKAHVEAPVSGSMVLAGVLLKLGGYGFYRFSCFVPFYLSGLSSYFLSLGLLGGLVSCFLCLRQVDLKAFVAYSSVCHMGFGLVGFYSYSFYGLQGGIYMLVAHGFCSSCLFYILYVFYERFHTRSLFLMKGVGYLIPMMLLVWFVFSVLNMGVPPSFSFFSEILILTGGVMNTYLSVFFVGLMLFFAGIYGIYLYVVSCHGLSLLEGTTFSFFIREYLSMYGHMFPLLFLPFFLRFF